MQRVKYTVDFKKQVISEFLEIRKTEPELLLGQFAKRKYPEILPRLLYTWRKMYESEVGKQQNMSENEIKNKYGTEANSLSMQDKFRIILEVSKLSTEEFGEYCRQKGLYASDIERWKYECENALNDDTSGKVTAEAVKNKNSEIKQLRQQIDSLKNTCKSQEREIERQNKTLAIYAAKVTSLKNFQLLFGDKEGG